MEGRFRVVLIYLFIFLEVQGSALCLCGCVCVCACVPLSPVKGDPRGVRGGEAPSYMCYPGDAALGVTRVVGR